jgi:hypothetical protein
MKDKIKAGPRCSGATGQRIAPFARSQKAYQRRNYIHPKAPAQRFSCESDDTRFAVSGRCLTCLQRNNYPTREGSQGRSRHAPGMGALRLAKYILRRASDLQLGEVAE